MAETASPLNEASLDQCKIYCNQAVQALFLVIRGIVIQGNPIWLILQAIKTAAITTSVVGPKALVMRIPMFPA